MILMKILGVITARGNSKRVRNKNTLTLLGKPLISYTINAARRSKLITRLVCSSDSDHILALVRKYRVATIKRPAAFAADNSPIEDALRHGVDYLKAKEGFYPELVVLFYANIPYRAPGLVDAAIRALTKAGADALVTVSPVDRYHPERLVLLGKERKFIPYVKTFSSYRSQKLSKVYFIDSGLIVFRTSLLYGKDPLIVSHYFKGRKVIGLASNQLGAWDIDTSFDLEIARLILKRKQRGGMVI